MYELLAQLAEEELLEKLAEEAEEAELFDDYDDEDLEDLLVDEIEKEAEEELLYELLKEAKRKAKKKLGFGGSLARRFSRLVSRYPRLALYGGVPAGILGGVGLGALAHHYATSPAEAAYYDLLASLD
jgi:hypothetical protein